MPHYTAFHIYSSDSASKNSASVNTFRCIHSRILLKRCAINDYLVNWIYPRFWDDILNTPFVCTPALLIHNARGQLPYSNFKIGKSITPTNLPSKYCVTAHPLYKILALHKL